MTNKCVIIPVETAVKVHFIQSASTDPTETAIEHTVDRGNDDRVDLKYKKFLTSHKNSQLTPEWFHSKHE
jgi:hypothetical protein